MGQQRKFILFSDLHMAASTREAALASLRSVRELCTEHKARPIFLGDFWNVSNVIDTETLNAVIDELRNWSGLRSIWIPGNHDQVDLAGMTHGLEVVQSVIGDALLATEPMTCAGTGLRLIPYRRQRPLVMQAFADKGDAVAVLCHIDVLGAKWNDKIQALHGIPVNELPADVQIFTGHYHCPHAVDGAPHVVYIGSPYQTGFAEAGQQKRVVLVEDGDTAEGWRNFKSLPLDIGPRHYNIDLNTSEEPDLRPGDRVIFRIEDSAHNDQHRAFIAGMQEKGVAVEVRIESKVQKTRIKNAASLGVTDLWRAYAVVVKMAERVRDIGLEILAKPNLWTERERRDAAVRFVAVDVEGYGPFLEKVTYPLDKRGAVLVTGCNLDDPGSESNGAGKTTLVMATLWALTGRTDLRPSGNTMTGLAAEMVNDDARDAIVELVCEVNGLPLIVTRTMGKAGHKLGVNYGGDDCSGATVALSQAKLDSIIDTELLARTVFFGQHSTRGFLEMTDSAAKAQLAEVVSVAPWEAALAYVKVKLSSLRTDKGEHETALNTLQGRLSEISVEAAQQAADEWEAGRVLRIADLQRQIQVEEGKQSVWLAEWDQRKLDAAAEVDTVAGLRAAQDVVLLAEAAAADVAFKEVNAQIDGWKTARVARVAEVQKSIADLMATTGPNPADVQELARLQATVRDSVPLPFVSATTKHLRVQQIEQQQQLQKTQTALDGVATRGTERRAERERRAAAQALELAALRAQTNACPTCQQEVGADKHAALVIAMEARHAAELQVIDASIESLKGEYRAANNRKAIETALADIAQKIVVCEAADKVEDAETRAALETLASKIADVQGRIAAARQIAEAQVAEKRKAIEAINAEQVPFSSTDASRRLAAACSIVNPHTAVEQQLRRSLYNIGAEIYPGLQLLRMLQAHLVSAGEEGNPHAAAVQTAKDRLAELGSQIEAKQAALDAVNLSVDDLERLEAMFGKGGVQNYAMEDALADLQNRVHTYLDQLSGGYLSLELQASTVSDKGKVSEKFSKTVLVRRRDGRYVKRDVQQLSGGQWRREATAMTLAHAEFVAARTGIQSNLLVLDEVFQHLDPAGRARVSQLVRGLDYDSILVITHDIDLSDAFETVDRVVMSRDVSTVHLAVDPHEKPAAPVDDGRKVGPVKGAVRKRGTVATAAMTLALAPEAA